MQILNALALVHLEGDLCRLGTGVDQTRGAGKRRGIGVLILKAPGVGHQARQETRRDVRRAGPPRSIEELVHKDCGRGSRRHAHRDVAELFARGMMVDHHATASPLSHRSGILKTLESGNVDRDEQVVRLRMPNSGLQLPGKGQKAVYARDGAIVGKQKVDALVGKLRPDRSAEPENRAEGVTIGIRVPRDRDGAGASTKSMTPAHISGVVLRPEQGDVLLLITHIFLNIGILDGIAEFVLLDGEGRGDVLEGTANRLRLVGGAVDLELELGSHTPVERTCKKAANSALAA